MEKSKERSNSTAKEQRAVFPTNEQLTLLLESLFGRQRLIELAYRCTTRDPDIDLRQVGTHELIDILIKAWEIGPKKSSGTLWGAVDQELTGRLKSYLGLGEQRLRDMLTTFQSEGGYDRKMSAILLWVLLHEKHETLLSEFEKILSHRYRDTGSLLFTRPLCMSRLNELEEQIEGLGRELKGLIIELSRQVERLGKRTEKLESARLESASSLLTGGSESLRRRLEKIPEEEIRVGVFVDVQNMFYAAKKLAGARLDYESMLDRVVRNRRLIKAVAYIVESSEIDQSAFISVLKKKGYQVRRKELKSFLDGTAKGDWDMGMAIDIIEMAGYLDVVALVTGDGDFVSLVRLVKKLGPRVELYAFGHNLSNELKETSDDFFEIGSDLLLKNHHYQALTGLQELKEEPSKPSVPDSIAGTESTLEKEKGK